MHTDPLAEDVLASHAPPFPDEIGQANRRHRGRACHSALATDLALGLQARIGPLGEAGLKFAQGQVDDVDRRTFTV